MEKNLQKIITVIFLILSIPLAVFSQSLYSVSGKLNGCTKKMIFFSRVIGKQTVKVDSMKPDAGCNVHFVFPDSNYKGVFRISDGDSNYANIIFNKENISFETAAANLSAKMKIIESAENKEYYEYLRKSVPIDDSINLMTDIGQKLYDVNHSKVTPELNKVAKKISALEQEKRKLNNSLVDSHLGYFATKVIHAMLPPDYKEFQKNNEASEYPNENAFLREHFFDNIDFADSNMLHTSVIFDKIGQYFQYFASPASTDAYKKVVDFILIRAAANKDVEGFVMNTLMSTFDHTKWDDVFSYVVEKYLASNTCGDDSKRKKLSEKDNIIKALKQGNKAPSILAADLNGKEISLDSVKAKYTLIMFWASWCEFCDKAMPDVRSIYSTYKSKGLEIYAVSLDSIKQNWEEASRHYVIQWINTCNLMGFESPVIKDYNIWQTPTFYLLDANKKIISRPANTNRLKNELGKINWE